MASWGTPPHQSCMSQMNQMCALHEGEDYVVFPAADEGPRRLHQDSSFWEVGDKGAGSDTVIFSSPH